jgi:hypothetical protein
MLVFLSIVRFFCPNVFETGLCTNVVVNSEIPRFIHISSAVFKFLFANRQVSVLKLTAVALQYFVANALKEESELVLLHAICVFSHTNRTEQMAQHYIVKQHTVFLPHTPPTPLPPAPA